MRLHNDLAAFHSRQERKWHEWKRFNCSHGNLKEEKSPYKKWLNCKNTDSSNHKLILMGDICHGKHNDNSNLQTLSMKGQSCSHCTM